MPSFAVLKSMVMTSPVFRLLFDQNTAADAGLIRERGNCEVYELEDISSQIRH